jgi:hypothetical protein
MLFVLLGEGDAMVESPAFFVMALFFSGIIIKHSRRASRSDGRHRARTGRRTAHKKRPSHACNKTTMMPLCFD